MTTSVDFDYNGPPVTVSNGMAVQLVAQFGIRNAWFAFLKLRGMKLKNEEAENARESFTYFRNKIGHLRRLTKEFNEKKEKNVEESAKNSFDALSAADFDNFFVSPDSLELKKDATKYPDVEDNEFLEEVATSSSCSTGQTTSSPTTVSLLQVIEENKRRQQKIDIDQNKDKHTEKDKQKMKNKEDKPSEEQREDVTTLQNKGSQIAKNSRNNKKASTENIETKQMVEKLLAAKEEIARRHSETIDDVVSVVMEKIRNNQPFEGELTAPTGHFIPPKSHHKRAGISGGQKMVQQRSGIPVLGQMKSDESLLSLRQQKGTVLASVTNEGVLTTATPTTAFSHFSPGQSIVLLQNPAPSSGPIQLPHSQISFGGLPSVSPTSSTYKSRQNAYNGQMMTETFHSQHQQQFPPLISSPGSIQGTVPRLQHQHIYTIGQPVIGDGNIGGGTTTTAIPLDMAIQQNMTVQELIQTLKVQGNRNTNTQIILQTNDSIPSTPTPTILTTNDRHPIQNQQETPDSSSQEASIQENALKTGYPKKEKGDLKKGRKKKKGENEQQPENILKADVEKIDLEANAQGKQKMVQISKEDEKSSGQSQTETKGKKQTSQESGKPVSASTVPNQKQHQRIDDLENQLKKLNKQLLTEKNKAATQKKRADKALSDLEKASDSIQLLKIDLACQKTDNNTLIAENIALKAENQQLRSKEKRTSSGPSTASATPKSRKRKEITEEPEIMKNEKITGRSRKSTSNNPKIDGLPEKTQTPPPLSSELGRRQSKRICVARNQFMRNFF
ncbi:hypothetical protein ACQ4LE_008031 [Meloidogyne hapla]